MKCALLIVALAFLGACSTPSYRQSAQEKEEQAFRFQYEGVDTRGTRY